MSKEARVKEAIAKMFVDRGIKHDADNVIKFHVIELDEKDIQALNDIAFTMACEIRIKRSGTGLTVLVFL